MADWTNYKQYDDVSLAILAVLIGHPAMSKFDDGSGGDLESLDIAFDECAWIRDWKDWE